MWTVLFQNNAASVGLFSWVAPSDCVIRAVQGSNGNMHVTNDPALTVALFQTPTELITVGKDLLILLAGTTTVSHDLNVPIQGGRTLFVHFSASKGSLVLFLDSADIPAD